MSVSKMPSCAVEPSPRTRTRRVVRAVLQSDVPQLAGRPFRARRRTTMPTFIIVSMNSEFSATKERRYPPFSWKRAASVRPASISTSRRAGSCVRRCQRW